MAFPRQKKYDAAVKMYESGLSVQQVANYFQITRQAMWKILRRRGAKMRPNLRFKEENHFYRGGKRASDRAHNLVEYAVRKGVLRRPSLCETCGGTGNSKGIQAHHPDYNQPLQVMWLCQPCHHAWHKTYRAKPIL